MLRKLGGVPAGHTLYLEKIDEPDRLVGDHDLIDLDGRGVESFVGRKPSWTLNVQGVEIGSETPTILVSDALTRRGSTRPRVGTSS